LERVKGIEPSSQAWEARILPLNHTRVVKEFLTDPPALRNIFATRVNRATSKKPRLELAFTSMSHISPKDNTQPGKDFASSSLAV
jgi:hypothetical protein